MQILNKDRELFHCTQKRIRLIGTYNRQLKSLQIPWQTASSFFDRCKAASIVEDKHADTVRIRVPIIRRDMMI